LAGEGAGYNAYALDAATDTAKTIIEESKSNVLLVLHHLAN
jgi:hypothetical protein